MRSVKIEISRLALQNVFEECDRYNSDETGGRMVGHFALEQDELIVRARGVIEPGPKARRTRTSFFQDGDYQTEVFRRIEAEDPTIEHLGNWHTHHVNGYPNLSGGDIATYRRIVNHELHNLDFFYALLVTSRREDQTELERYAVRHYLFFRGDDEVYEVGEANVTITDEPMIWPTDISVAATQHRPVDVQKVLAVDVRVHDERILKVMYPTLKPRLSGKSRTFFWKGPLTLVDGSEAEVRVVEVEDSDELVYFPTVSPTSAEVEQLCETPFRSASEAARALELVLNRAIYESVVGEEA